jgi:hypothetical protein
VPASLGVRAVAAHDVVRQALGPDSGWSGNDDIRSLAWLGADRAVVVLAERAKVRRTRPAGEDSAARTVSRQVQLLVQVRDGAGVKAEQLHNPTNKLDPSIDEPRLLIGHISEAQTQRILGELACAEAAYNGTLSECLAPKIHREPFKIDLARICAALKTGDIEQFCEQRPSRWSQLRHRGRTLVIRGYDAPDGRTRSDLFLMEPDQGGGKK